MVPCSRQEFEAGIENKADSVCVMSHWGGSLTTPSLGVWESSNPTISVGTPAVASLINDAGGGGVPWSPGSASTEGSERVYCNLSDSGLTKGNTTKAILVESQSKYVCSQRR